MRPALRRGRRGGPAYSPPPWRRTGRRHSTSATARSRPQTEEERSGVFRRLREGLTRSRQALTAELSSSFTERIDEETWEHIEEALILADVGAPTTAAVVRRLEDEVEAGKLTGGEALRERLIALLAETASPGGEDAAKIHLPRAARRC